MDSIDTDDPHGLFAGYRRFRERAWQPQLARWDELRQGQSPHTLIIACSDSRVDPAQIFDVDPGELFVVRNVAAMVPPYETTPGYHGVSAAVEFAVNFLRVEQVVVMGHGMCGGCKAALSQDLRGASAGEGGFVASWVSLLDETRAQVAAEHGTEGRKAEIEMERAGVRTSIANLRSFPFVVQAESEGRLAIHGAHFAISDGLLHWMNPVSGKFAPVAVSHGSSRGE